MSLEDIGEECCQPRNSEFCFSLTSRVKSLIHMCMSIQMYWARRWLPAKFSFNLVMKSVITSVIFVGEETLLCKVGKCSILSVLKSVAKRSSLAWNALICSTRSTTFLSLPCCPTFKSFKEFESVTQKADVVHEVVIQYVFQVCFRLFLLAAVEESCNLPSEITETSLVLYLWTVIWRHYEEAGRGAQQTFPVCCKSTYFTCHGWSPICHKHPHMFRIQTTVFEKCWHLFKDCLASNVSF